MEFFRAYPYSKPHILFYSNSLAIWHGLPDNGYIKVNKNTKVQGLLPCNWNEKVLCGVIKLVLDWVKNQDIDN